MKPVAEHIPFLDYVRGLAILSVFFFHSLGFSFGTDHLPWVGYLQGGGPTKSFYAVFPAAFGWVGVPIFFAVSGFCIHLSHQRSRYKSYKVFFLRRFFRIYPPYLLALLFFAFLFYPSRLGLGLRSHNLSILVTSTKELMSHIFLIHNFSDTFFFGTINASFWSIAVEAQLYILYPLLLWLAMRLGWQRTLLITGVIELGLHSVAGLLIIQNPSLELSRSFTASPFCFWFSWSTGAALADAYLKGEPLPFRSYLGVLWPMLLFVFYFFKPLSPFTFTMAALSSTYLMAYWLTRPLYNVSLNRWGNYALGHLRWAGIVSYSAYLIHQPLLRSVPGVIGFIFHDRLFHPLVMYGFCLCSWFPIFGLSYCFYRYVELPSIALGKQIIDKSRSAITASKVSLEAISAS